MTEHTPCRFAVKRASVEHLTPSGPLDRAYHRDTQSGGSPADPSRPSGPTPDARVLARKIHELRIFPGPEGAVSASDLDLPVLVVSQFTLYADTRKGRRPSWQDAAPGEVAEPLVDAVVAELRRRGATVATGVFGAKMQVSSVNEGPMTLLLEV